MGTRKRETAVTDERFEELDVEVKDPTVVISARLDAATARQLTRMARIRGARLSDVVREALARYAASGGGEGATYYVVTRDLRFGTEPGVITSVKTRDERPALISPETVTVQ